MLLSDLHEKCCNATSGYTCSTSDRDVLPVSVRDHCMAAQLDASFLLACMNSIASHVTVL